jgi:hypothetical protein
MHNYPCASLLVESVNHSQLADLMMTNGAWKLKMPLLSCRAGQVNRTHAYWYAIFGHLNRTINGICILGFFFY